MTTRPPAPHVIAEGERAELDAAAAGLAARGLTVVEGAPEEPRADVVVATLVTGPDDVVAAVQAAAAGHRVLVVVPPSSPLRYALWEDLNRLGGVKYRPWRDAGPPLTEEQRRLVELLRGGASVRAAARALYISPRTAHRRLEGIRDALGVETTAEALVRYEAWAGREHGA
jgi:DNA-binding NarL/FixJ family response regulator